MVVFRTYQRAHASVRRRVMRPLTILYRGHLVSCNYGCHYCPFAKRKESTEERARDAGALERFVTWAERWSDGPLSIFFTPWGEAFHHRHYHSAVAALSRVTWGISKRKAEKCKGDNREVSCWRKPWSSWKKSIVYSSEIMKSIY